MNENLLIPENENIIGYLRYRHYSDLQDGGVEIYLDKYSCWNDNDTQAIPPNTIAVICVADGEIKLTARGNHELQN